MGEQHSDPKTSPATMPGKGRGDSIREWLQAIALGAAVVIGLWQFWLKEIVWPAVSPINLSTELAVKKAGLRSDNADDREQQFEAVELTVTAKNPSTRTLYLLENIWIAQGVKVDTYGESSLSKEAWLSSTNNQIADRALGYEGRHYAVDNRELVAAGRIFPDDVLYPGESISASFVFFVPQGAYDLLNVYVVLPSTGKRDAAQYVWTLQPHGAEPKLQVYRIVDGRRGEQIKDLDKASKDPRIQLQSASSVRQLSLWPSTE